MEGNTYPEIGPSPVEGTWHAWIPDSRCCCGFCGAEAHGRDEGELLAKLPGG
jgi:hypothetical protein